MTRLLLALFALLAITAATAQQRPAAPPAELDRLQRADGAGILPERFLRRWDPVTMLFDSDTGPAAGGPEDRPERFATLTPPIPGAWQWLGPRMLQFRPAEAWQPLQRVTVTAGNRSARLTPLLQAPVETAPAARAEGIANLDTISLTFPDPVDAAALARLVSLELRAAPGTAEQPAQQLTPRDFDIKPVERAARADQATYLVVLRRPVPDARTLLLRLRLSDEAGLDDPSFELRLQSAAPFTLTDSSCGEGFARDMVAGVLRCAPRTAPGQASARRSLALRFAATPETLDVLQLRQALRLSPAVDDLAVAVDGNGYRLTGRFQADITYELRLAAGAIRDTAGRPLAAAPPPIRFAFLPERPLLRWDAGQGIAERLGPQMVPARGRGHDRADLRIHAINPLAREFWPFPAAGIDSDDDEAPPLPGNEPTAWTDPTGIPRAELQQRLRALGTPAVSEIVALPSQRNGVEARFGLDIRPHLARIAGAQQPGTYLLGLRAVDGGRRRWMRLQVTDLALSTVEENERVRFTVTSLATARPVDGAEIRLEGARGDAFTTLARGVTGSDGSFTWAAPPAARRGATAAGGTLRRITVIKGNDVLVLEPNRGPQAYANENWTQPDEPWLSWTPAGAEDRREAAQTLCHLFTERPIYRPEEPVHVQGFVRRYLGGRLSYASGRGTVVLTGPSDQEWRIPVTLNETGGFHHLFNEQTEATGEFTARFEPDGQEACGEVPFRKEAYRLPTFEVLLNAPPSVPMDAPFDVGLLARYFAGGMATERPLRWRVTQFPQPWTPPARDGFLFSSDSRFSAQREFRSTAVLEREARTDAGGSARLALDPTLEPTAQPRRYVVEATVTGDDDIEVRTTQHILALPPFVLGLKVPRYIPQAGSIEAEFLAVNGEGQALPGLAIQARLLRRNWNAVLQASDFAQGQARYRTEVIDELVEERSLTSAEAAQPISFAAAEAGVYILELAAEDRSGRRQVVRVDLFMAGDTPVTWPRAPAQTATVTTDQPAYAPGETATLLIQSPFQSARALVVVEEPDGRFRYDWTDIANGFGRYTLQARREQMPRLAVHVLVMRGRLAGQQPSPTGTYDLGKPVTVAATAWVTVTPVQHRVNVTIQAPASARPGEEVEAVLRLADENGRPLAGEAAFWLVDQAVLSLAREQPLDPLPRFIVNRPTRAVARDTRNMAFGLIPLEEMPGGDEQAEEWGIENIAVRRNFTPVPLYLPRVRVGADGVARIRIRLPDTLTVFRLRAKVVAGPERFGFGTGELRVRQPVVAQPVLPRFVRPGDRFTAAVLARLVEGPGGAGRAALSLDGLAVEGAREQAFTWAEGRPARIDYAVTVPEPPAGRGTAQLRFLLQRNADRIGDAAQIELPIHPDRPPLRLRGIHAIAAGSSLDITPPANIRPGSYAGSLVVAADPVLVRLLAGINQLLAPQIGGTEQRLALVAGELALRPFAPLLQAAGLEGRMEADLRLAQRAIQQTVDEDGLVAMWPRQRGTVHLTASAFRMLVAAGKAGLPVDAALQERLSQVLQRALRSDYPRLLSGEELRERVAALLALAEAGQLPEAFAAELARRAASLPSESLAQVISALATAPQRDGAMLASLQEALWARLRLLNRDGRAVYAGLADGGGNPLILPSETRSLSEMLAASSITAPSDARTLLLRHTLVGLADGRGWGSSNANAAALRALAAQWAAPPEAAGFRLAAGAAPQPVALNAAQPLHLWRGSAPVPLRLDNIGAVELVAISDQRAVPQAAGSAAEAVQQGFALTRRLFRIPGGNAPPEAIAPDADGVVTLAAGEVVEEVVELLNPERRNHVALRLPLAAGLEPLNPALATAPAEAAPSFAPSQAPSWAAYRDDEVVAVFTELPAGNLRLAFRSRAQTTGSFTQPPGEAETLYLPGIYGASAGQRVVVTR